MPFFVTPGTNASGVTSVSGVGVDNSDPANPIIERQFTSIAITSSDFSGNDYVNANLVGLTAGEDFDLYTNEGSGVLLKVNDGYTFNTGTGAITTSPSDYSVKIYV